MAADHCCCCHILTNAAVVGMLQLLIIVLTMAASGTILDRWRMWEETQEMHEQEKHMKHAFHFMRMRNRSFLNGMEGDMEKLHDQMKMEFMRFKMDMMKNNMTKLKNGTYVEMMPTGKPEKDQEEESAWMGEAWMEIHLSQQIGVCALWITALIIYGAAFKYYKAVFVLPNFVLQVISIVGTFFMIISLACGMAKKKEEEDPEGDMMDWMMDENYTEDKHDKGFIITILISTIIIWFLEIYFVVIIHKFYKFLKDTAGQVFPGFPQYHPALPVHNPEKSMDL